MGDMGRRLDYGRWGRNVSEARQARGLSRTQLAARVDVGHDWIARLERGDARPSDELKLAIARELDLRPDLLFPLASLTSDSHSTGPGDDGAA